MGRTPRASTEMRCSPAGPSGVIDALTDSRVNTPALQLSQSVTLSPAERRRLERNAAAERVRLADVPGRTEKERLQLAQTALNRYDALLARWQKDPQAAEDVVLARIDRLGALYAHADYPRVISEYQDLTAAQHPVPGWAIGWVISAYLQEKNAKIFSKKAPWDHRAFGSMMIKVVPFPGTLAAVIVPL